MVINTFLDFYDIFVNQFVGDPMLFLILTLLLISFILVRARAPNQIFILVMFSVGLMLSVYFEILRWPLALFGGVFIAWMLSRLRRE